MNKEEIIKILKEVKSEGGKRWTKAKKLEEVLNIIKEHKKVLRGEIQGERDRSIWLFCKR